MRRPARQTAQRRTPGRNEGAATGPHLRLADKGVRGDGMPPRPPPRTGAAGRQSSELPDSSGNRSRKTMYRPDATDADERLFSQSRTSHVYPARTVRTEAFPYSRGPDGILPRGVFPFYIR